MHETATPLAPAITGVRLGERVRTLRVSVGITQTQLAGERFSKEYISQIERGKTRPTESTIVWLAERLGVDPAFLSSGVSTEERAKVEAHLARAEALSTVHEYDDALAAYREVRMDIEGTGARPLELRALAGEAWALQEVGQVKEAIDLLLRARELSESSDFSDIERADVLSPVGRVPVQALEHLHGDCAVRRGARARRALGPARATFSGPTSSNVGRAAIAGSATTLRRTTMSSVRSSLPRPGRPSAIANAYFQASLVSQRQGHYVLSRSYAQRAKELYQQLNDERNVGRLLLMLGGLTLLLGDEDNAVEHLKASYSRALDTDSPADAAQALEGIAKVHLSRGEYDQADSLARNALELLQGREDYLHEVCPSQLVLGRALMERGRLDEAEECFRAADAAAEQLASISHRTEAWVALGDLAARRGHDREAARLYRNAAEALQEIRF